MTRQKPHNVPLGKVQPMIVLLGKDFNLGILFVCKFPAHGIILKTKIDYHILDEMSSDANLAGAGYYPFPAGTVQDAPKDKKGHKRSRHSPPDKFILAC
jgi:hypothetical protein